MAFSQYFAEKILGWLKGGAFPTALSSVYVTLHTADPGTGGTTADVTNAVCGIHSKQVLGSSMSATGAASGGGFETTNGTVVQMAAAAVNGSPVTISHFGIWNAACSSPHGSEEFVASGALTTAVEIQLGDTVQFNTGAMSVKVI